MGILILNNAGEQLTIQDFFITDASRGSGYYGAIKYILPPNGHQVLSNSIFTRQTWNELKPLEVHIKINGKTQLVLHHNDFEKNQEMAFLIDSEKKLAVNVVPRVATTTRGFAYRIWAMIPSCGPAASIEALVAPAKLRKPRKRHHAR